MPGKDATQHAFITGPNGAGGANLRDVNTLVKNAPTVFKAAWGINDAGHVLVTGANGHAYLLCPTKGCL